MFKAPDHEIVKDSGGFQAPAHEVIGDNEGTSAKDFILNQVSNAVSNSPLGMVSKGAGSLNNAMGSVMNALPIPVGKTVQGGAQKVFNASRAMGVGAANYAANPLIEPSNISNSIQRGKAALDQNFKPRNVVEKAGAFVGENAPIAAATAISPNFGGPVSLMAKQAADTGKVSPIPALAAGASAIGNKLFPQQGLQPETDILNIAKQKSPFIQSVKDMTLKALGVTKRFLKKDKIPDLEEAGLILNDKGVISGDGRIMAERNTALAQDSGSKIGQYISRMTNEKGIDGNELIDKIEALRPAQKGGLYNKIHTTLDTAADTIKANMADNKYIPWDNVQEVKQMLQDQAFDKAGTKMDRIIAGTYRQAMDDSLNKISIANGDPQAHQDFLINKKIYKATQIAEDPIYNKISSEQGNMKLGLSDLVLAAPEIAAGYPITGMLLAAGRRGISKFGPANLATMGYRASRALPYSVPSQQMPAAITAAILKKRK